MRELPLMLMKPGPWITAASLLMTVSSYSCAHVGLLRSRHLPLCCRGSRGAPEFSGTDDCSVTVADLIFRPHEIAPLGNVLCKRPTGDVEDPRLGFRQRWFDSYRSGLIDHGDHNLVVVFFSTANKDDVALSRGDDEARHCIGWGQNEALDPAILRRNFKGYAMRREIDEANVFQLLTFSPGF
ncbi:hypothetical protein [Actinomyces mediterranea]|uniref:hypothetical protein n=1 Tax=Actinomyces mediterranea TaxID=1871028 RepID=UPI0013566146|nr:hypothetical protein [Actinomyces mediterranea]